MKRGKVPNMENRTVKVASIKDNPQNARKSLERNEGSIAELAASIKTQGLINALVVVDNENGSYELRAGSRRLAAVKELGWEEVRVCVLPKGASKRLMSLAENTAREDLTMYETAAECTEIARTENMSGAQIAKAAGLSASHVNNMIRMMNNLPKAIKEDWKSGHPMATRENLSRIAGMVDKETKQPLHAKMIETWNAIIGADDGEEGEEGEEGGDDGDSEEQPRKVNAKVNANRLIAILSQTKDQANVSAMQCLQYVVGTRKSLPNGLKDIKE